MHKIKEPVPGCVKTSCARFLAALLARHWLRHIAAAAAATSGGGGKMTLSNLHSGSWVLQVLFLDYFFGRFSCVSAIRGRLIFTWNKSSVC